MTHARHKGSLGQSHAVDRRDGQRHLRHPHGDDDVGGACAERSLRFGRTKKIVEVIAKRGRGVARRGMRSDGRQKHRGQRSGKPDRRRDKRRGRKLYPLRGRTAGGSEGEGLSCHVLLTRLEEGLREQDSSEEAEEEGEARGNDGARRPPLSGGKSGRGKCRKQRGDERAKVKPTKRKAECDLALSQQCLVPEPRKRRMASLNAEAVNSLLLERATDQQPAAKLARKRQQQQGEAGCGGGAGPLAADPTRSGATANATASAAIPEVSAPRRHEPLRGRGGSKRVVGKAQVRRRTVAAMMSPERLNAPAPRRLAGLNAAALLKLTSSSGSGKPRARAPPTTMTTPAVAAGNDRKAPPAAASVAVSRQASVPTKPHRSRVRAARPREKRCGSRTEKGRSTPRLHGNSTDIDKDKDNNNKADFEPKVEWEKGGCAHRLTQPGYQSRGGLLAYPLKPVKEEQVESELGPYYCCPPGGSVGYCHRLALFLGRSPAYGEAEEQPSVGPVKRECLVAPPTLTHGHAHAALTLGPHPCLCAADHCFSSYYVHIAHPPHTAAGTPSPGIVTASRPPLGFSPGPALCPGRVGLIPHPPSASSGKLLDPRGVAHHPACCGPVGSPCYAEACGIGSYAYRAMPPVATRGCSFSEGCAGCARGIKSEGYPSPQGREHSPSLLTPHPLTPLSEPDESLARLRLARERPQRPSQASSGGTAAPPGNAARRLLLDRKQPGPAPLPSPGAGQRRASRRRATNGWRPVGVPTEREVFIAGEDETALRRCYDGVERDGEVIHIRDTVLLRSGPRKKSLPFVAKISALWEDPKTGELMMSLFWYYRPEHTQGGRDARAHCENEIFASRHQDENSVACIEDRCYVLPLAQYCRFCALVKRRAEGAQPGGARVVPGRPDFAPPSHRCVPADVDPHLVYLCRHVYDFRYGRILKNLQ